MNNKKRSQLIGFITLILVALVIVPYVITDKSPKTESTIMLFHPDDSDEGDTLREGNEFDIANVENENDSTPIIDDTIEQFNDVPPIESMPPDQQIETTATPSDEVVQQQAEKGYTIQLVALKNKQKIEELIALLRLNNYDVYTQPKIPKEGQVTRLMVGNYPTKEQAELVSIDLANLTKLKGFVTVK